MTTNSWPTPPPSPTLGPNEVHVWRATLDLPVALLRQLATTLAPDEEARAQRYHFAQHRDRFIAARGILRSILARYLHMASDQVRFAYDRHGKPRLQDTTSIVLNFNLSHAEGLALYAITSITHVGIDLEVVRPALATSEIAAHFFSPTEVRALAALPNAARTEAFFACWTRKEAYCKALGEGLSLALDRFTVSVDLQLPALLAVEGSPEEPAYWALRTLDAGPGYQATLAVRSTQPVLCCWQWQPTGAEPDECRLPT